MGMGLSIGSVSPHRGSRTCVRNVHFRNARLEFPIKAVRVAPLPNPLPILGPLPSITVGHGSAW